MEAIIRGSVMKAFDLLKKKNVIPGFTDKEFFVKSYSRPSDELLMSWKLKKMASLDVTNIAQQSKCSKKYYCALQKCTEKSAFIASQEINTKIVGRKKVIRSEKKQIGSPEKEVHVSSQLSVGINQNTNKTVPNFCLAEHMQKLSIRADAHPEPFMGGFYKSCSM